MSKKNTYYGIVCIVFLSIISLFHLFWTITLSIEQIKTGWGNGTSLELGVLYPLLIEFISIPFLITEIIFLSLYFIKYKVPKSILIINVVLFISLLMQYAITWLFIIY